MTDPEREHFARQVADLEARLRRWQLLSFVLAALMVVSVVGIGLAGVLHMPRMAQEREALRDLERARMEALEAEMQARRAVEAEMQARQAAEEAVDKARAERGKE